MKFLQYLILTLTIPLSIICNTIQLTNPKKNWVPFFHTMIDLFQIDTFVETGTFAGNTTAKAASCFAKVHSIELDTMLYKKALIRFDKQANVTLHHGDSAKIFPLLIPQLNDRILFWLDGHYSGGTTAYGDSSTPIMQELAVIKHNALRKSVLLIDDLRLFRSNINDNVYGDPEYPFLNQCCEFLTNAHYNFVILGDILVAYPQSMSPNFSTVIHACTVSRLFDGSNFSDQEIINAEQIISQAKGIEKESVKELHDSFCIKWKNAPLYNVWYGLILKHDKLYEQSNDQFKNALATGYDHWRIYWYLAENFYHQKKYREAKKILKLLLHKNPTFDSAQNLLKKINNYTS